MSEAAMPLGGLLTGRGYRVAAKVGSVRVVRRRGFAHALDDNF